MKQKQLPKNLVTLFVANYSFVICFVFVFPWIVMQLTIFSELLMNKNRVNIGIFTAYIFCMHFLILLLMIIYRIIIIGHFQAYSLPQVNEYPEMGFRLMTLIQGLWRDNFLMMLVSLLVFIASRDQLPIGYCCASRSFIGSFLLFSLFYVR